MEQGLINKLRIKISQWLSEPLGDTGVVPDSKDNELKKPVGFFETSKSEPILMKGRGDKREIPHRIEEFHPRGEAGRREIRGPRGAQKAVMPHKGSRPKYPQG